MKKELLLLLVSGTLTTLLILLTIRWLAPGLLGVPVDLQLVQVDNKLPPFFSNIFRPQDQQENKFILQDPVTKIRARPFYPGGFIGSGPNDILGFRNRSVPNVTDIITIGDSQTYGTNAPIDLNWPNFLGKMLKKNETRIYNMSTGGWCALQYLEMTKYAILFQPKVIVIAFYTGNDPMESFSLAYGSDIWKEFRLAPELNKTNTPPRVKFPSPPEEQWPVSFSDGVRTIFTPKLRLYSNLDHPATNTGYEIMAEVATKIHAIAKEKNINVFFTIIPTKELVYQKKIDQENITAPEDYTTLVTNEIGKIERLKKHIMSLDSSSYIDVVQPLQNAALEKIALYPLSLNGHPVALGYKVIGENIAEQLAGVLPVPPKGMVMFQDTDTNKYLILIKKDGIYVFDTPEIARKNGWDVEKRIPLYTPRDLANYEWKGIIVSVKPASYGPDAVSY